MTHFVNENSFWDGEEEQALALYTIMIYLQKRCIYVGHFYKRDLIC